MKTTQWLNDVLNSLPTPYGKNLNYLKSRGVKDSLIERLNLRVWDSRKVNIHDEEFESSWGKKGFRLNGSVFIPLYSPTGTLIGCQIQKTERKLIIRELSKQSLWNPVWVAGKSDIQKICNGDIVWLVEGLFDMSALDRIMPESGHVVVSCMTAKVSSSQMRFLKRFSKEVNIVFDMDETGDKGSRKAIYDLKSANIAHSRIKYPTKDPGDLWKEQGDEGLRRYFLKHINRFRV